MPPREPKIEPIPPLSGTNNKTANTESTEKTELTDSSFFARVEHHFTRHSFSEGGPRLILLTTALALAAFFTTIYLYNQNVELANELALATTDPTTPAETPTDPTATWQTYSDEQHGYQFKYPTHLALEQSSQQVILHHEILYKNYGDCDMNPSSTPSETLTDFRVSFEIIPESIQLDVIDGTYTTTSLNGSWVYEGAEGCGHIVYYFPLKNEQTLIIKKDAIQALSGISTVWPVDEILQIPDIIPKEESNILFDQILSTFQFTEQTQDNSTIYRTPSLQINTSGVELLLTDDSNKQLGYLSNSQIVQDIEQAQYYYIAPNSPEIFIAQDADGKYNVLIINPTNETVEYSIGFNAHDQNLKRHHITTSGTLTPNQTKEVLLIYEPQTETLEVLENQPTN